MTTHPRETECAALRPVDPSYTTGTATSTGAADEVAGGLQANALRASAGGAALQANAPKLAALAGELAGDKREPRKLLRRRR